MGAGGVDFRRGILLDCQPAGWSSELGLRGDLADRLARIAQDRMAHTEAPRSRLRSSSGHLRAEAEARSYVVELVNDDVTPMNLVVHGLQEVFGLTWQQAAQLMLQVHETGRAACAGFESETAAKLKVEELRLIAMAKGYSLGCAVRVGSAAQATESGRF